MFSARKLLIVGGSGNLGKAIVSVFKETWKVTNVDISANQEAASNIQLDVNQDYKQHSKLILSQIPPKTKFEAILCVAGGWVGGGVKQEEIFDSMTCHLATHSLGDEGLLVLTGAAAPFQNANPDMFAYSISKTATHAMALNMSERKELSPLASVVTILPQVIDTPQNRTAMPNEDHSQWAKPSGIAALLKMWAEGNNRPSNGSFALLKVKSGQVVPEFV